MILHRDWDAAWGRVLSGSFAGGHLPIPLALADEHPEDEGELPEEGPPNPGGIFDSPWEPEPAERSGSTTEPAEPSEPTTSPPFA